ncbi:MAG TPA: hypothetical protein DHW49_00755 [Anaerolineae bacterium]|nr:hypothetical protein [Anaerolineae bacterium]
MTQEYIQSLRNNLKDFPPEEQEILLDELMSHIESGEDDPIMGKNKEERIKKLMSELGNPQDLSKGFKSIYRNNRFIDFLLIVIPYLLYPFLNVMYSNLMTTYNWVDVRLDILIHLPLVVVGLWRKSTLVTLFWVSTLVIQIFAMLISAQGYYGNLQTIIWLVIAFTLITLLGNIVWHHRYDALIIVFALLPLTMLIVGIVLAIINSSADLSSMPQVIDKLILDIYINFAGFGSGYLPFYGTLITISLFVLATNHNVRWIALGFYGLVIGLSRHHLNLFDEIQGLMAPPIYLVYAILPLVLVLLVWRLSQSKAQTQI